MIIATAGHVDHGKSSLVRRLTGTDPDRWAEERERGLTIDLGFAWTDLPSGRTAAFVDVPGHRRFVANALSGCGAVDGVLLAISAREGWRPQTEEHVAMLDLLGAPTGVVALTFTDTVDASAAADAARAVAERLAGTFLAGAPILATGADGRGDEALRQAIDEVVTTCPTARDDDRPRLWIDRSFLLDGVGRVVTGTLSGGAVATGGRLAATDGRTSTLLRIRSLRRNGEPVERATPGARVALAVRADGAAPQRGQAVVRAEQWQAGRVLHVTLTPARGHEPPRPRGSFLLHLGTWSAAVRLSYPRDATGEGVPALARLHLDTPLAPVAPGDRFVLRDAGRAATVAGGLVLAVDAAIRRRPPAALRRRAESLAGPPPARTRCLAAAILAEGDGTATAADLRAETGTALPVGTRPRGDRRTALPALRRARAALEHQLAADGAVPLASTTVVEAHAAADLVDRGLAVERDGVLHAVGRDPAQRWRDLAARLDAAVVDGSLPRLFTTEDASLVGATPRELRRLDDEGLVVAIPPFLVTTGTYRALAAAVRNRLAAGPATAAELKDAVGLTRRHAIPLLEALDRDGLSRRVGDLRIGADRQTPT